MGYASVVCQDMLYLHRRERGFIKNTSTSRLITCRQKVAQKALLFYNISVFDSLPFATSFNKLKMQTLTHW